MMMILNSIYPSKQIEGIYLVATEEGLWAEKETCFWFYLVPPSLHQFHSDNVAAFDKGSDETVTR